MIHTHKQTGLFKQATDIHWLSEHCECLYHAVVVYRGHDEAWAWSSHFSPRLWPGLVTLHVIWLKLLSKATYSSLSRRQSPQEQCEVEGLAQGPNSCADLTVARLTLRVPVMYLTHYATGFPFLSSWTHFVSYSLPGATLKVGGFVGPLVPHSLPSPPPQLTCEMGPHRPSRREQTSEALSLYANSPSQQRPLSPETRKERQEAAVKNKRAD